MYCMYCTVPGYVQYVQYALRTVCIQYVQRVRILQYGQCVQYVQYVQDVGIYVGTKYPTYQIYCRYWLISDIVLVTIPVYIKAQYNIQPVSKVVFGSRKYFVFSQIAAL